MTIKTAPLDPKKEVKGFSPEHVSVQDDPRNDREFILVQDGYSEEMLRALDTLGNLIGPMITFMSDSSHRALGTLYRCMQEKGMLGKDAVGGVAPAPMLYSLAEDEEGLDRLTWTGGDDFEYQYPDPESIAGIMVDLDAVPDNAEDDMLESVGVIRDFLGGYAPEYWPLSDTAVFVRGDVVRDRATEVVVERSLQGEADESLAAMVRSLDPEKGVVVLAGTALWDMLADGDDEEAADGENADDTDAGLDSDSLETRADWDTKFVNDLPDDAFALILPGGKKDKDGKTAPRSLRKLPHHGGMETDHSKNPVDMPHLRNALARLEQTDIDEDMKAKAKAHLEAHAGDEGVGDRSDDKGEERSLGSDAPETEVVTPPTRQEGIMKTSTEQSATAYIRSLAEQADPTLRGETNGTGHDREGGVRTDSSGDTVNLRATRQETDGDPDGEADLIGQMRAALKTPGLGAEQREGILRHFLGQIESQVLEELDAGADDGGVGDDGAVSAQVIEATVRSAIEQAVVPLRDEIAKLQRALADRDVPRRRSLPPTPQDEPVRGRRGDGNGREGLASPSDLAWRGIPDL